MAEPLSKTTWRRLAVGFTDKIAESSLYLIAGPAGTPLDEFGDRLRAALKGGIDLLQLREKQATGARLLSIGQTVAALATEFGCPLIVNDDPNLALDLGAQGVHVGQEDLAPVAVRSLVGRDLVIGQSTHSEEQLVAAEADPHCQMMGFGPIFSTTTKDAGPPLGAQLWQLVRHRELKKPVFAIGGINEDNLVELMSFGCRRIAVSQAILSADDVEGTVRRLQERLKA